MSHHLIFKQDLEKGDLEQNKHTDTNNLEQNTSTSASFSRTVNLSENHTNIQINLDPIRYFCNKNDFINQNISTDFSSTKKVPTKLQDI